MVPDDVEPSTIAQALKNLKWVTIMNEEYAALLYNNTWTLLPPNPKYNVVGNKWVFFRIKQHPDGSIDIIKPAMLLKVFTDLRLTFMRHLVQLLTWSLFT